MASLIFLDTNVPIYAAGKEHPLKAPCAQVLSLVAEAPQAFVTDAEVLQELLHRYAHSTVWPGGRMVLEAFFTLMRDRIEAVLTEDVAHAVNLVESFPHLSARDLVHLAVMTRVGADRIVSADRAFDALEEIRRLDPAKVSTWRRRIRPPAKD
ncbi:MAG: type II toxin-antitoxin system VapC family toxin [Myxococcales bacterium]|nr:type II toxin-antitoxin system VapC family toxin [Myxococcales bacterium]